MSYQRIAVKNGYTFLPGKWTRAEIKAYFSGELPSRVKVPVDSKFEGSKGLMTVLGYRLRDVVRKNKNSTLFAIYSLEAK